MRSCETICPYHAALCIADCCPDDPEAFLFARGSGEPFTKVQMIEAIHEVLEAVGVQLMRAGAPNEPDINRFGGHCLRVWGGAGLHHHAPRPLGE